MISCREGGISCFKMLLKDRRVDPNKPNFDGRTPLWMLAAIASHEMIKYWVASGREMDLGEEFGNADVIGEARSVRMFEIADLLEKFKENPEKVRHEVRVKIGWYDERAAEIFALVIFLPDGLLKIKEGGLNEAARFFKIATGLPMELQMVLCRRVVESMKTVIHKKESEVEFRELAKVISSS